MNNELNKYVVVCDDSNNPPESVDNNLLSVDIFIRPNLDELYNSVINSLLENKP